MKTTKRLVSFVLCLLMIAALSAPAFAAAPGGTAQLNSSVPLAGEDYISCYSTNGVYYEIFPKEVAFYVGYGYANSRKAVRLCQAFCEESECTPSGIDGYFGSNTENAIIYAQHKYDLADKDGICGPATWSALYFGTGGAAGSRGVVGDSGVIWDVRALLGAGECIYP